MLLLAVAAVVGAVPNGAAAYELRVLSYNIHHSQGIDGAFSLNRIASIITAANPDIVALQELDQGNTRSGVNVFQLNQLAQLTGMQGFFGKTINYQGGEYGNGVLVRSDLPVTHVVNRPMPLPVVGEARAIMEVGVSLDGANATPEFSFFATHFTNNDEQNRFAQAAFVNSLIAGTWTPALVAGDFNDIPASRVIQRINEEWQDSTDLPDPGKPRALQIDYVFYRGPGQWNVLEEGRFIVNSTAQVASDHYPILAVVELVPTGVPEPSTLALAVVAVACAFRYCCAGRRRADGSG